MRALSTTTSRASIPLALPTPGGLAELVPGSLEAGAPRYAIAGEDAAIDVAIPPDLAARWFWHGCWLVMRTEPGTCGLAVGTSTWGVAGAIERARIIERLIAEREAAPRQMEMELC